MALPKLWLRPVRDDYNVTPGNTVVSTQLDGGASRQRKDQAGATAIVPVSWILGPADYDYIQAFYRTAIDEGSLPFLLDLLWEKSTPIEYTVQIVPSTFQLTKQEGLAYFVSATLEVFPNPVDVANDNLLLGRNSYNA